MAIFGRLIRPIGMVARNNNQFSSNITRVAVSRPQLTRPMSADSNYHYHEKPAKHDLHWRLERYLSLGLLGVLPAAAVIPHPIMDYAVAVSLVVHTHWGLEAIVSDYVRPSIFGPTIPKLSLWLVNILSMLALGGLFVFNYTDVGITQATRMLAKI